MSEKLEDDQRALKSAKMCPGESIFSVHLREGTMISIAKNLYLTLCVPQSQPFMDLTLKITKPSLARATGQISVRLLGIKSGMS
jgi:hypothetical protein